jgi:integrase/recombinase XerD
MTAQTRKDRSPDSPDAQLRTALEDFTARLQSQGYAASTLKEKHRYLAAFDRWSASRGLSVVEIDDQVVVEFFRDERIHGRRRQGAEAVLGALLRWLRDEGLSHVAASKRDGPLDEVEGSYAEYLDKERGLSAATRDNYLPLVHRFLVDCFGEGGPICLSSLCAADVIAHVERHARRGSRGRAKLMATALRSFFRFLRQRGDLSLDLAAAVPCVANWRLASLPKGLEPEQVEVLLQACDQTTAIGRRDYAILLLLARLGLRAGEVVSLALDDIDWDAGTLVVHGKGPRRDLMPLVSDVGEAIVAYLRSGRPACSTRRLFVRARAPHQGFTTSVAICVIVKNALARAGLESPRKGAHIMRHALATGMLQRGASLGEIGDVLRHRHPDTTMLYTKVDLAALRPLARPWLGGEA